MIPCLCWLPLPLIIPLNANSLMLAVRAHHSHHAARLPPSSSSHLDAPKAIRSPCWVSATSSSPARSSRTSRTPTHLLTSSRTFSTFSHFSHFSHPPTNPRVFAGAFVSLMRNLDLEQKAAEASALPASAKRGMPNPFAFGAAASATSPPASSAPMARGGFERMPYFTSAIGAYVVGLGTTFAANYFTKSGQPALVYIVPSLLLAALATAASRGEVEALLGYKSARAAIAAEEAEAMRSGFKAETAAQQSGK